MSICLATVVVDQAANVARPVIVECALKLQYQDIVMALTGGGTLTAGQLFAQ
jgi:hypothetical protein